MASQSGESNEDLDFEIRFYERLLKTKKDFVDVMIPLADAYTQRGFYEKGLRMDLRLARLCMKDSTVFYNLACSYALVGDRDKSLRSLRQAVKLGYLDWPHMAEDPDLSSIRNDHRFTTLIQKLKKESGNRYSR
jgi:tetratricopeptide (TPR) repeat protein